MNVETLKVNVTTVVSIVIACFVIYWYVADLADQAVIDAKVFAIGLDIERDEDVIEMYRFQIENGIGTPQAPSRMASLQDKVARRMQERLSLESR